MIVSACTSPFKPDQIQAWKEEGNTKSHPWQRGYRNGQLLGEGQSVLQECCCLSFDHASVKATYPRIYVQHTLDLMDTHTHNTVGCVGSREQGYLGEVEMRRSGCNKKHIVGRSQRTENKQNYGSLRVSKVVSLHLCKSCCVSFPRSHGRPLPSPALFPSDLLVRIFAELLTP